jgi:type IV fimbrial biogenesis protein FimT
VRKHNQGFTILELMMVVTILGITTAIAAPSFTEMIKNNRISSSVNDFVAALQFAKAEAVARVNPVTICIRNNDGTACAGGGGWQQGWIVFSDLDGNGAVDNDDRVLLNHEALDRRITFGGTAGVSTQVTYRPSGTTSINNTEVLIICDDRDFARSAKGVLVTITGRGSVLKASDTGQTQCI